MPISEFLLQNVFAAVGRGLYVYNLQTKRVIACQKAAHDSIVLRVARLPNRYECPPALPQVKESHSSWGDQCDSQVAMSPGFVA